VYFLDTSAVVKAYIRERGSETVQAAFERLDGSLFVSELVMVESMACFARLRRKREISTRTYRTARNDFLTDLTTRYRVLPVPSVVFDAALAALHTLRERGIGAPDAVHVCAAEWLRSLVPGATVSFMCSDEKLRKAAASRGFRVFDPETDPLHLLANPAVAPPGE
jgi:predicted nucleic acid-binding protein